MYPKDNIKGECCKLIPFHLNLNPIITYFLKKLNFQTGPTIGMEEVTNVSSNSLHSLKQRAVPTIWDHPKEYCSTHLHESYNTRME